MRKPERTGYIGVVPRAIQLYVSLEVYMLSIGRWSMIINI